MKNLLLILLFAAALGCKDEATGPQMGCHTAIPNGSTTRVNVRCVTQEQYNFGSNVAAGGWANWNLYTNHQWKAVSDCKECQ